jgi:hypothetical protein
MKNKEDKGGLQVNQYKEWKDKQAIKFNRLPLHFAFNNKQFKEMLKEVNLTESNYQDQLVDVGEGGYIKKTDKNLLTEYLIDRDKEYKHLQENKSLMYEAFREELKANSYIITHSKEDTLKALRITPEEVKDNKVLTEIFEKACTQYSKEIKTNDIK